MNQRRRKLRLLTRIWIGNETGKWPTFFYDFYFYFVLLIVTPSIILIILLNGAQDWEPVGGPLEEPHGFSIAYSFASHT
ncbi:hypothetical protein Y032_0017g3331 [Ancylostoma ceylanicum]|uniref:Uncharacterized protein n=1 Tax=Ancylostoma ceylanicum TaxID=53326 RepID=A0A016V5W1_9BILA|nr:hypothetical protein Y032_0017g3331 [Ancylostoma ceylanicum]